MSCFVDTNKKLYLCLCQPDIWSTKLFTKQYEITASAPKSYTRIIFRVTAIDLVFFRISTLSLQKVTFIDLISSAIKIILICSQFLLFKTALFSSLLGRRQAVSEESTEWGGGGRFVTYYLKYRLWSIRIVHKV